jgi:hypothetical protein
LSKRPASPKRTDPCSEPGNPEKAIEIALGIQQLTYQVGALLNAASPLNRFGGT